MRTSAFAIAAGLILSSCNADSVVNGVFVVITTAATAQPADKISRTFELSLGQVREMQIALSSLERREGSCKRGAVEERCSLAVPTCLGDIKSACIPLDVSEGDEVLYSKYGGTEIKVDGEDLLVLRESDVLAKVEA
jgi:hypothetical protein